MKSVIQNEMTTAIAHEKDIKTFFGGVYQFSCNEKMLIFSIGGTYNC